MQYFIDGKYRKIYYNKPTGISFYKSRGKEVNVSHMFKKNGELRQQYKTDSNNVNKLNNKTELNKIIKNNPSILIRKTKKKKKRFLGGGNINFAMISPEINIQEITPDSKPADIVDFYIDLYRVTILVLSNLLARYDKNDPAIVPDTLSLTTVIIPGTTAADNVTIQELLNCLINLFNAHSTKDFSTAVANGVIEEPAAATVHTTGDLIIEDLAFLRTWSLTPDGEINTINFKLAPLGDPNAFDVDETKIAQKFLPLDSYISLLSEAGILATDFRGAAFADGYTSLDFTTINDITTQDIEDIKLKIKQSAYAVGVNNINSNTAIAAGARNIDIPDSISKYNATAAPGTPLEFDHNSLTILIEIIKTKMERMRELKANIITIRDNDNSINNATITGMSLNVANNHHAAKAAILLKHYLSLKNINQDIFNKLFR